MAEQFSYKLNDLDPTAFKKAINSRLDYRKYGSKIVDTNKVDDLLQNVLITEVQGGLLDKRRYRQNLLHFELGFLERDVKDKSRFQSPGKKKGQGESNLKNTINKYYHSSFNELFALHLACAKYEMDPKDNDQMYEKNGDNGEVKSDKKKLTTDEYCDVIDKEMAGEWLNATSTTCQSVDIVDCLVSGMKTLAGRISAVMQHANELMKDKPEWKNHIKVIISLAVYLLVLDQKYHKEMHLGCGLDNAAILIIHTHGMKRQPKIGDVGCVKMKDGRKCKATIKKIDSGLYLEEEQIKAVKTGGKKQKDKAGNKQNDEDGNKQKVEDGIKQKVEDGNKQKVEDGIKQMVEDGNKQKVEDGIKQKVEDGNKQKVEDGNKQKVEDGIKQKVEDGNKQKVEDGIKQMVEDGNKQKVEDGIKQKVEDGNKQKVEDGIKQKVEDGNKQKVEDGNKQKSKSKSKSKCLLA